MPLNIDISQILLHMLNLAILFAAGYFLFYKPIKNFMSSRNDALQAQIEENEKEKEDAENLKAEYEHKLEEFEEYKQQKINEALEKSEESSKRIIADAKASADKILDSARAKAQKEKEAIVKSAYTDIYNLAKEAAENVVYTSQTAYDKFIDTLTEEGESVGREQS